MKSLEVFRKRETLTDSLYKLNIDTIECQDGFDELAYLFEQAAFTDEGCEWYSWYLYELPSLPKNENHAWDENEDPIILTNDEELWDFFVKNKYLR